MKRAMQPDAIRCQPVRSCGSTGRKGRQGAGGRERRRLVGWLVGRWVVVVVVVVVVMMICYDYDYGYG